MDSRDPKTKAHKSSVLRRKLVGFSLIEIMVALTIMGLIVGVVGVYMMGALYE